MGIIKSLCSGNQFEPENNMLPKLHISFLLKIKAKKTFSLRMRSFPKEIGGLGLYSLQVDLVVHTINYFLALYLVETLIKILLKN